MKIKKLLLFLTVMLFTANLAFTQWTIDEGFEGGAIPAGWTTSSWGVYSVAGYPHTGSYLAASGMGNDWLITPQVYIQSGDSFIFWTRAWNGTESFNVKLSTTGNATGDFTTTLGTYTGVGETWLEYSYDLSAYTGNIYLAIEVISGGDYVLGLDDVLVGQEAVSCPAPSNIYVTNILETQADFGWTENGGATVWNIEVGAPGFTPGTTAYIQAYTGVTSNPYTGIGLTASTNYEFYVQADCGGGETSTWAGPEAFSTQDMVWGLLAGDIAFTAFNADGDDDFAIVALIDIPANATIYFTDNEPNATGDGFEDFNEGTLKWATGGSVISAGTIVVFTDTDSDTNPLFGASVGTLSVPSFDSGMNLSSSGDALYAVEGSPEGNNIAAWLAGIQNEAGNEGANFSATGLTFGTTFINYYVSGSPDGGYYSGLRVGQSSFSAYLPLLGDNSNWTVESSNGENILPISTTAFTIFIGPDNPSTFAAVAASSSEIDLDWTQNAGSNDVLVAWNSSNTFGTPTNGTTYSAGNPIAGGGTVLYYGPALHFDHTSLTASTPYFYKAWSYDGSEYSFGVTDDATTLCVPYTADFSENFDGETPPELPDCWSHLEISASTIGYVSTSTTSSYSLPNNVRMYKYYTVDDLLLITPQLGDLTSQSNQIRFMGRASGWAQDLIIGTMSDPTDETTFTPFQTIPITIFNVYEEYTVVFDETYTLSDEYIAFKHGADINYSYLNIDDFVYEAIPPPPVPGLWTGTNSSDWATGENWDDGVVPTASTNVTIPTGLTNYPTLSAAGTCNNILFSSDATGTATLLDNGYLTINGIATVERYFSGNDLDWHLVSSPISDATANVFFDMYLQSFTEVTNSYTEITDETTPLNFMEGYGLYSNLAAANTVFFTGTLNFAPQNHGFTAGGAGWNLLGNPFVSSIDWEAVSIPTGMSNEVHYIRASDGADLSYVQGTGGPGSQYIAPHQGFFVSATAAGTLYLYDGERTHNGADNFYKNDNPQLLILEAANENFSDQAWIHFNENAGVEHDGTYDAYKRISLSNPELPQIFSITQSGTMLSINGMPETSMVPVGFTAVETGVFTISAIETSEFANVVLEDLLTQTQTDLLSNPYTFNYTAGDQENRFIVHFTPLAVPETFEEIVNIFSFNTNVYVTVPVNAKGNIFIYNMMGQEVASKRINDIQNIITLEKSSYYVVKVLSDESVVTKKVFIK